MACASLIIFKRTLFLSFSTYPSEHSNDKQVNRSRSFSSSAACYSGERDRVFKVVCSRPRLEAGIKSLGKSEGVGVELSCKSEGSDDRKVGNSADGGGQLFIFGFGYSCRRLALDLRKNAWSISGTAHGSEAVSELEELGFESFVFNCGESEKNLTASAVKQLQQASHWLLSIPPQLGVVGDPVLSALMPALIQAVAKGNLIWIGYLSSTGVYGDWQGNWVDEDAEPRPSEPKAIARLAAEKGWLNFGREYSVAVQVFRLGGIYGHGRNALNTLLNKRKGGRSPRERRQFTSRIHVDDICQVVKASILKPNPGRIYNVVDDEPASRKEVFSFAENLLKKVSNDYNSSRLDLLSRTDDNNFSYAGSCEEKKVSNQRIKQELGVQLLYPTYSDGLQQIWQDMFNSG